MNNKVDSQRRLCRFIQFVNTETLCEMTETHQCAVSFKPVGLLMGFIWSTWTISYTSSAAICTCNIASCEQRCNVSEGVYGLSCFGKRITNAIINYNCVWNPGKYDNYYLYIKQGTSVQCGPPSTVSFKRSYGHLNVTAEWDDSNVKQYHLKYREHNSTVWKEVQSQNSRDCTVGNVSSKSYEIQICCVVTTECPQCPLSDIISIPPVAFQPYKRYHIFLHARHEKDTCNLKHVNNSDLTLGRTQVYLTEGTPLTAPGNISSSKATQNSLVITWCPVREEDLRGVLQGYIIRYTQDNGKKDITVHPSMNSYELLNLQSGSIYCVELSAFTAAGEGKRSESKCFDTLDSVAVGGMLVGIIAGVLVLLLATHLCFRLLKRSKKMLWPSIPNPCNSNAVQKIECGQELEVMEILSRPYVEETEEHVFVLEAKKETHSACCDSQDWTKVTLMPNKVPLPEDNEALSSSTASTTIDSTPKDALPIHSNHLGSVEDPPVGANDIKDAPSVLGTVSVSTDVVNPTRAFMSDYTTMELFQQITNGMPSAPSGSGAAASDARQDYLRQSVSLSKSVGTAPDPIYLTEGTFL
ncbi:hypothetical protein QTP70_003314 [Hemibagrus guttatus]|uniref:Fibronectin type-III domain-containing protein n=1 Tax=Hemibagrus guttatus TaxID=175788 RepID=A0AAE0UL25_9TELE|nr:hypothetical protein QTP70_003314 [Hemibagrus guttatus]